MTADYKLTKWLPQKEVDYNLVNSILRSSIENNQFSNNGPVVDLLQKELKSLLDISEEKSVILTSQHTMAIQAIVGMLSRKYGRKLKVVTQSFTFPSSALLYCSDATIVDIDEEGGPNLEEVPLDTDVLIVTNVFGHFVDLEKYEKFCKDNNIFLLFDNAASALTYENNINICNRGDACIVSLHHTKPLGFGEGGFIVISKKFLDEINDIIGFGLGPERLTWSKFAMNARMSDVSAAYILQYIIKNADSLKKLSLIQTKFCEEIVESGVSLYPTKNSTFCVRSCLPILTNVDIKSFIVSGIEAKKYYKPLTSSKVANSLYNKIICLPFHIDITSEDLHIYRSILLR